MDSSVSRLTELVFILRTWFLELGVTEVTTPILINYPTTEPTISNLKIDSIEKYLRTSSEFELKKILIEKDIDVFEIGHVFRADEQGAMHLTEFRMLEWYRRNKSYKELMREIELLLKMIGVRDKILHESYQTIFEDNFNVCLHQASDNELKFIVSKNLPIDPDSLIDRTELLDSLNLVLMNSKTFKENVIFVYDFPAELRGYSELCSDLRYAKRFELYLKGVELVNGYQEIIDVEEQEKCFIAENRIRLARGIPSVSLDQDFLKVLRNINVEQYSGAALGVERLLAFLNDANDFSELQIY